MYRIIGADQKEYGPITADQLRAWLNEGRINAQTRACAEGTDEWKPLGSFPEFSDALPATAATPSYAASAGLADGGRADARRSVKGPALAILITAAIGAAYYAVSGIFTLAGGQALFQNELPPNSLPR